jgi:hypothetical protein
MYVIIAEATNMGLSAMAESCGVPYDVLAWTAEWYFRPETLEAANAAVVNYHHRLPLTRAFGSGTLSSSDGQRFPVKGKSITARHLSRYFARGQGVSTYTHVSDQHSTFDTKVIVATAPESHYVLDGLLGNETDLPVFEHATDTHARAAPAPISARADQHPPRRPGPRQPGVGAGHDGRGPARPDPAVLVERAVHGTFTLDMNSRLDYDRGAVTIPAPRPAPGARGDHRRGRVSGGEFGGPLRRAAVRRGRRIKDLVIV